MMAAKRVPFWSGGLFVALLGWQIGFFGGLSVLNFFYAGALYVLSCIGPVWALRRGCRCRSPSSPSPGRRCRCSR